MNVKYVVLLDAVLTTLVVLAGVSLVLLGVYQIYPPLAKVLGGLLLVAAGVGNRFRKTGRKGR